MMVHHINRHAIRRFNTYLVVCLFGCPALAQDADTSLLLHFESDSTGVQGESPTQALGLSFVPGVVGQGLLLTSQSQLRYATTDNIDAQEGTLDFWIKPDWNGNDSQGHVALANGGGGGMLFAKDGANNLRSIFNRFGSPGQPEAGVAVNIGDWVAGDWHHVAYTWSNISHVLQLFVDGRIQSVAPLSIDLPLVPSSEFQIGAEGQDSALGAVIDELRISSRPRTPAEIAQSFMSGVTVSSLNIDPNSITLPKTWTRTLKLTANTNFGIIDFPPAAATWHTSDPAIATVSSDGTIRAVAAGTADISAEVNMAIAHVEVTVTAPAREPEEDAIDPYLTALPDCYLYEMPVAVIRYLPTQDGVNIDSAIADFTGTVDELKARIDQFDIETRFMLQEGSRFHDFGANQASPALGYRVVKIISVFEELPPDLNPGHSTGAPGVYFPDYNQILSRFDIRHLVDDLQVKEIWLWGYHHGNIVPVESNMSSPTTGDVSNSFRFQDDLPVLDHTYVLYNYNFTRSSNESVHDHGHQLEAILSHVAFLQDGNADLFWKQFVGQNAQGQFITGRCGWTHMPPNTTQDYDYYNLNAVPSDIEDWTPDKSGTIKPTSAATWTNVPYVWPNNTPPDDLTQHQWYVYWMQSMPGWLNTIPHGNDRMANWWAFTADWDASISKVSTSYGLYAHAHLLSLFDLPRVDDCLVGPANEMDACCVDADFDHDGQIDLRDIATWLNAIE